MAFTKAAEVAALVKRHVLPGVVVSIGEAQGSPGIEVVVRGYKHPDDGFSRLWLIDLIGNSSAMLDLTIVGLRKAGFDMRGAAPLMRGVLTQMLTRVEIAAMRQAKRDQDRKVEKAQLKADLQAETLQAKQQSQEQIEVLRDEVTGLKEMVGDLALMPQPRGPQGPAGPAGKDGEDGTAVDLGDAELKDLGDVLSVDAEERQVLTWKDGKWQPLYVPRDSGAIYNGGGGGEGGGSFDGFEISERAYALGDPIANAGPKQNLLTGVTSLAFNTESGFGVTDLGNNEALISMSSTFNPWHVDGEETLDATGEEPVEFVAGPGVTITTDATTTPKQIKWEVSGGAAGGIPEAPADGRFYVRQNGSWVDLQQALAHLMVGDGGAFTPEGDGGDFNTGESSTTTSQVFDGGDFTSGSSSATDEQIVDGQDISDPYFGTTTGPDNNS